MNFSRHTNTDSFTPSFGGGRGEAAILIANRGEIAVRIIRAAQKNGIRSVAVYATDDTDSLHVSLANEAVLLPGKTLAETYLNQDKLIRIALEKKVEAIHSGYGFLSENAGFAQKVADAGLVFVGPTPENIRLMGEKNRALAYVESLGIPILKSFRGSKDELLKHASGMEFPVMVKASGGGGGKGMLICQTKEELLPALQKAERQAMEYFGNGDLFVEKYLPRARHIEVQLMADNFGNVLHFFERECSVQRRFQKIIEEAPSPSVTPELREKLTSTAVQIARSMNYRNAGTIEFLLDENEQFYFLEMNTRIQVEHPVTEMITGIDLVSMQLAVAAGNPLAMKQEQIQINGHAIEGRLCAEDAEHQFQPSAGKLDLFQTPECKYLRLETFVHEGLTVSARYDSLLAKIVVHGQDRDEAISRFQEVLQEATLSGIKTNLPFLAELAKSETFRNNQIYTKYIDENLGEINYLIQERKQQTDLKPIAVAIVAYHFHKPERKGDSVWNQLGYWRQLSQILIEIEKTIIPVSFRIENRLKIEIQDKSFEVEVLNREQNLLELKINGTLERFHVIEKASETIVLFHGFSFATKSNSVLSQVQIQGKKSGIQQNFQNLICADLFGKVLHLNVTIGAAVSKGQTLLTLESMKTEIHVLSPTQARIKKIHVKTGETVAEKQVLIELEEEVISRSDQ
jgi:acetyl/propionyl-CoA carboxylase alpha subunit